MAATPSTTGSDELYRMDWKVFNDAIHGHMSFDPLIVAIIDTPQFQRLRNIKQLGVGYLVYPSASHNRFEHSLGTCYLAGELMNELKNHHISNEDSSSQHYNPNTDGEWNVKKLCVQVAALCHDLGHGPFSHTWEQVLKNFEHEEQSIKLFGNILQQEVQDRSNNTRCTVKELLKKRHIDEKKISLIENLITGKDKRDNIDEIERNKDNFLFQIVNNEENGIDVDKWDYLIRDKTQLNVPTGFDYRRLLNFCQIRTVGEKTQICYRDKVCVNIVDMFVTRTLLHDRAYKHNVVKTIEVMLIDAFKNAIPSLPELSSTKPEEFIKLTDHVYYKVLHHDMKNVKPEDQIGLKKAQNILNRIEKRELYKNIYSGKLKPKRKDMWGKCRKEILEDRIKERLKIKEVGVASIDISIDKWVKSKPETQSEEGKGNQNLPPVYVFKKTDKSGEAKEMDWTKQRTAINIDMNHLRRQEVLVLYKGNGAPPELDAAFVEKTIKDIEERIEDGNDQ